LVLAAFCVPLGTRAQPKAPSELVVIDASKQSDTPPAPLARLGGKSSSGREITVNSRYLTLDGKPWLPVMGEFHYSRYPEPYWEEELLKMKAGGVQIVSTYVFWIHHEEIEGQFDWSGQRDLQHFVQLCKRNGLYVFLRIGPYAHGEVRNGGLPDWVVAGGAVRKNDPHYLAFVRRYFEQIGKQVSGLFWKDDGPIIGVQLENEYAQRGPDAGAAHISELKRLAHEAGLDAPLYTITGWDDPDYPAGEVIPMFGGYVDNFWDSSLEDLPPTGYYLFETRNIISVTGKEGRPVQYPFFMAEAGGGIQSAYHRRPVISGDDIAAMTLTRLGSGANLYGYYMFQGGANPEGKLTSLQESAAVDHVYDLPRVSYDFQAPLGQFGQMNPPFRATKLFHLFLNDFGSYLAPMETVLPQVVPKDAFDRTTVRVAARVQGNRGFVFVNNYQRLYPLPEHHDVQFRLALPNETLVLPRHPVNLPSGAYFIWPVNLDLNGALLKYATAQLLTKLHTPGLDYYFFFAQPGMAVEFCFDESRVTSVEATHANVSHAGGRVWVDKIVPSAQIALSVLSQEGKRTRVIVFDRADAGDLWKGQVAGQTRIILSPADDFAGDGVLHLRTREVEKLRFSLLPDVHGEAKASAPLRRIGQPGPFTAYLVHVRPKAIGARWTKVRDASPSPPVHKGKYNAVAPSEPDGAGLWRIVLPNNAMTGLNDLFLQIRYAGDVANLYAGDRLLADDYFKGTPWEVGLKRFLPEVLHRPLDLKVLPLRKDAPIYIPRNAWPKFDSRGQVAEVDSVRLIAEYDIRVTGGP
jgi:hypothetical protein